MRVLVYTGCDAAFWPLGQLTVPRMVQWAQRHGYDFQLYTTPLLDVPNGIYWTGVAGAIKALDHYEMDHYDRVMYLDIDQCITNFDWEIPPDWTGFHASQDWGKDATEPWQFSMCGFVADHSCEYLLQDVLDMEPHWRDKPFPEQAPIQAEMRARQFQNTPTPFHIHPRRVFNAVPSCVSRDNVPEPWVKGVDFAAHLTMLPLQERIDLFHAIESGAYY